MENKDIRELAGIMKDMGITSLEYHSGGESVKLTRPAHNAPAVAFETDEAAVDLPGDDTISGNAFTVKSPMVGVFYSSPGADGEPYAAVGDTVHVGDLLCMIEAMKIMNEITAERNGVINAIYAENRQVVEYGQPLFMISAI